MVVFDADIARLATADEVERDWPRVLVYAGCIAELSASSEFWQLVTKGPALACFEDPRDAHAVIEAYAEHRCRRLN
jgi:hypothetical protein